MRWKCCTLHINVLQCKQRTFTRKHVNFEMHGQVFLPKSEYAVFFLCSEAFALIFLSGNNNVFNICLLCNKMNKSFSFIAKHKMEKALI